MFSDMFVHSNPRLTDLGLQFCETDLEGLLFADNYGENVRFFYVNVCLRYQNLIYFVVFP